MPMEILKKIDELKKIILKSDQLIDNLIKNLDKKQTTINNNEARILHLKDQVKINVEKIDKIIDDYNANS
jgi:FKBP-type peptidyl-prolyl cis-trans isomerase (trigger factor)